MADWQLEALRDVDPDEYKRHMQSVSETADDLVARNVVFARRPERHGKPLTMKQKLGRAAVAAGFLVTGAAGYLAGTLTHQNRTPSANQQQNITLVDTPTATPNQNTAPKLHYTKQELEQEYGATVEIDSPNGHSVLFEGLKKNGAADLYESQNGEDFTFVTDNVEGAAWADDSITEKGKTIVENNITADVFAVLSDNPDYTPGSQTESKMDIALYQVGANGGIRKAAEEASPIDSFTFDWSKAGYPQYGVSEEYYWTQDTDPDTGATTIDFHMLHDGIGGTNPDGSTWVGGMEVGDLQMQLPPSKQR